MTATSIPRTPSERAAAGRQTVGLGGAAEVPASGDDVRGGPCLRGRRPPRRAARRPWWCAARASRIAAADVPSGRTPARLPPRPPAEPVVPRPRTGWITHVISDIRVGRTSPPRAPERAGATARSGLFAPGRPSGRGRLTGRLRPAQVTHPARPSRAREPPAPSSRPLPRFGRPARARGHRESHPPHTLRELGIAERGRRAGSGRPNQPRHLTTISTHPLFIPAPMV